MSLDLSNNSIVTVVGQGLPYLPNLMDLSLKNNTIKSLEDTLNELERCPKLQVLFLVVRDATTVSGCLPHTLNHGVLAELYGWREYARPRSIRVTGVQSTDGPAGM